ncbi:DNA-binding protein [Actinoplanes sp. NPDC026670]|uniref:DNA-binding protein n=1 Tax=Actinoplanes sp. NPDC026670 TaxID=3154700 RepID=UPI0033EF508D
MTIGVQQGAIKLDLVGAHEIRVLFGSISRQRVYQITKRADFPRPVADLAQGKVWLASEATAWRDRRRSPHQ